MNGTARWVVTVATAMCSGAAAGIVTDNAFVAFFTDLAVLGVLVLLQWDSDWSD